MLLPFLPWVEQRDERYGSVARAWYRWSYEQRGYIRLYRSAARRLRWVRWEWPPEPRAPTHGWRAILVAEAVLWWLWERHLRVRRNTYRELWEVARGKTPFAASLVRDLARDVKWAWARHWARRDALTRRVRMSVSMRPEGLGVQWGKPSAGGRPTHRTTGTPTFWTLRPPR